MEILEVRGKEIIDYIQDPEDKNDGEWFIGEPLSYKAAEDNNQKAEKDHQPADGDQPGYSPRTVISICFH